MSYSTKKFTYSPSSKLFITEASMLASVGTKMFIQIYNDSCDEGLVLISAKTGQSSYWVVDNIENNTEGEIMCWSLIPTRDTLRKLPILANHVMKIFNT